jgi:hypothetical protein
MTRWIDGTGRRKLVLVESDPGLRRILQTELHVHAGVPADAITLEEFAERAGDEDSVVAALFDEREKIRPHLSPARRAVFIEANSVPHSLVGNERPGTENLIAVVTCWAQFAALAKVYLVATGIEPEALMIRRTEEKGWDAGLGAASVVICDSAAATRLGDDPRLRVFRLIPDSAIDRIKQALL